MAEWELATLLDRGVTAWNAWRSEHPEVLPTLRRADLRGRDLGGIDLSAVDLREVDLTATNLAGARLVDANLTFARLDRARLWNADLTRANFNSASLVQCDFSNATLGATLFTNVDLSDAAGLDLCRHEQASSVDVATLQRSQRGISTAFLRGVGVPEIFIEYLPSLAAASAIDFSSCFLSYSSTDYEFARRLYVQLQRLGVRVWFAPEDLRVGDRLPSKIDDSIRIYDKFVVVVSEAALQSQWVEREVEHALARERREGRSVLFPVTIDSAIFSGSIAWAAHLVQTRVVGDFRQWREESAFAVAVARLCRDLALANATERAGAK